MGSSVLRSWKKGLRRTSKEERLQCWWWGWVLSMTNLAYWCLAFNWPYRPILPSNPRSWHSSRNSTRSFLPSLSDCHLSIVKALIHYVTEWLFQAWKGPPSPVAPFLTGGQTKALRKKNHFSHFILCLYCQSLLHPTFSMSSSFFEPFEPSFQGKSSKSRRWDPAPKVALLFHREMALDARKWSSGIKGCHFDTEGLWR